MFYKKKAPQKNNTYFMSNSPAMGLSYFSHLLENLSTENKEENGIRIVHLKTELHEQCLIYPCQI